MVDRRVETNPLVCFGRDAYWEALGTRNMLSEDSSYKRVGYKARLGLVLCVLAASYRVILPSTCSASTILKWLRPWDLIACVLLDCESLKIVIQKKLSPFLKVTCFSYLFVMMTVWS